GQITCQFCGSTYTVETYIKAVNNDFLKNLVSSIIEDFVGKYGVIMDESFKGLTNQLCQYAAKVFEEAKTFYESQHRLPSKDELDQGIKEETQKILQSIANISQEFRETQSKLFIKIDTVTGKIDSIAISISELKNLLSQLEKGGVGYETRLKREPVLLFKGKNGKVEEIKIDDAVIGRNENTHVVEVRFANGSIKSLGIVDPTVSRKHLKIKVENDKIFVTDLESKNGTFIDGVKILPNEPYELCSDAKIKLGFNTLLELKFTHQ
ncbi:MAG: FHA domain-containing protein, partial [Nitrososphaeria archaeon]